ncbi:hypothetical protein L596_003863 [Steinernema carpocapsae]|uniref:Uncharacterized protein n=1 Tax=Steinernema carpocapsae TaxID=34508 RepID=A0A4U8UVK5_STECR|nr:hypothetical protein L596_003863 [Steinernema carpocapsae]
MTKGTQTRLKSYFSKVSIPMKWTFPEPTKRINLFGLRRKRFNNENETKHRSLDANKSETRSTHEYSN